MAAAGLDYYEGESPGPLTGVPEPERLEAVKLALELGNDINAKTHLGDYPMTGTPESMLGQYPDNFEDLANLGVGDPRWDGMTALHGAVISNQPSIVQFLVDHGAQVDAKSGLGWTPLTITKGIFMANSKKEFPAAAEILQKAMAEKGLVAANNQKLAQSRSKRNTSFAGGSGACVSIHRTGSSPAFSKLWMHPTPVQTTSPGPRS